jgi:hypothetical protein
MILKATCAVPVCLLLSSSNALAQDVVDFAARLIGRPYVWGAEGPNSFDCSGLTQYVYQEFGVELPRRAISQSKAGEPVGRRLQRGDLLFFASDSRQSLVTHVGLYEGGGIMIDASQRSGHVRRDNLSDPFWAERYMFARRVGDWSAGERDVPNQRRAKTDDAPRQPVDGRRAAIRVLERVADTLLKRPRR